MDWLLVSDADPAIRWQTMRDLTNAAPAAIAAERARVPHEGLAAGILAHQEPDGMWRRPGMPDWLPTLFTPMLLRATGVDPLDPAVASAITRLASGFRWADEFGARPFFEGEVEPCINGAALALGAYFRHPSRSLARRLVGEQLADGGWNCDAPESSRGSFHTTICVLEGLLEYERTTGDVPEIAVARRRGEEYLLERKLFRRRSTGATVNVQFLELAFPSRYHYDILRALDYFRDARLEPEARVMEAVHIIEDKRRDDGRWLLDRTYDEALSVTFAEIPGEPSRWNTLRALRVLRWCGRRDRR
jgi:hypothetical protein